MGFLKLLKGELNKILMRPLLYVITGVVIFAIIFSYSQFSKSVEPIDEYSKISEKYVVSDNTLAKVRNTFYDNVASNSVGFLKSEQLVAEAEAELEQAKLIGEKTEYGNKLTIVEYLQYIYSNEKELVSEPDNFVSAYNRYMNEQEFKDSDIDVYIQALANLLGSIKPSENAATIEPDTKYEKKNLTAIQYYITKIENIKDLKEKVTNNNDLLIPLKKMQAFNDAYIKIYTTIISENRPHEYDINEISNHASIRNFIKETNINNLLKDLIDSVKAKVLPSDVYNARKDNIKYAKKYMEQLKGDIDTLAASGDNAKVDELINLCVKYYFYAHNVKSLIDTSVKYEPVINMSDKQAGLYSGYSSMEIKGINENISLKSDLYLYAVKENITRSVFLIENRAASYEYAKVFNSHVSSNAYTNAFDVVYFGLEITSIVIIIFTVVLAAGMLAGEQSTGTLKLLLIRPYTRNSILSSKLLATIIFAAIFFVFSTIVLFLIGLALADGASFTPVLVVFNATHAFAMSPVVLLLLYLLCLLFKTIVFIIISFAISAIFRSNVGAVSISIVLYFIISILGTIFAHSYIYGFIPFSNLDLFKFFGGSFIPGGGSSSLLASLFSSSIFHGVDFFYAFGINLIVIAIITLFSYLVFKKREVK